MSFMSRAFGLGNNNNQQQQTPQPAANVATDPLVNPALAPKPDGSNAAIPKPGETLLDSYKDLHKPKAEGEAKGGIPVPVPEITINEEAIRGAMAGKNFLEGISADLIQKATKGDAEAFMEVIQNATTNAAAAAFAAGTETTKRALTATTDRFNSLTLPELNRRKDASAAIRKDMPFFDHPAVAPMLSDMERRVADSYPNASSDAIKDHAKQLMAGMFEEYGKSQGKVITDAPKVSASGRDKLGNEDWSANGYFDGVDLGNPFN